MNPLKKMIDALRVRLGWDDVPHDRLSPLHGWLLPAPSLLRVAPARAAAPRLNTLDGRSTRRG
jgi:hypothetical protein